LAAVAEDVADTAMINLLTFTTLYPNAKRPAHGVFVENRIKHLVASGRATTRVVAPVAYVPGWQGIPERYRVLSDVPVHEKRHGIDVHHPRYFLLPKISMVAAPFLLYRAAKRQLSKLLAGGYEFDLIDAHYFYPDGVAAILLGRHFDKKVTITARGSDLTKIPQYRLPRKMILWAAQEAHGIITVCQALKTSLIDLGVPENKIRVLRNGVDLTLFRPADREAARRRYGFEGTTLLSVGHLIPRKGHDLAIKALQYLPQKRLMIVGDGPEYSRLRDLAERIGVDNRVRFLGQLAHDELPGIYTAADLSLLLSTQEGWANVILESMACGTPVVATDAGGTPEVITTPLVGELVYERNAIVVARAIDGLLARAPDREAIRRYAEGFSWDATTKGQLDLFGDILRDSGSPRAKRHLTAGFGLRNLASSLDPRRE
jgi:teichuronic acid biosynthesis glycosyltransferase TuaC